MMASNLTLGLSVCRELSQNLRVVFVSPKPLTTPRPGRAVREGACYKTAVRYFARSVYHRRIILFTRLLEGVTKNRRISPRVSENYFGSCRRKLSGYMKKAPRVGATSLRTQIILGGDSVCLLVGDFFFGAEPVFHCVTVLTATCLVKFVSS